MKRWLLAWELGHGLGHLVSLAVAARQALLHGIEPVIVSCRPISQYIDFPSGCRFLQAPAWPVVHQQLAGTSNMSELLFEQGFAQPDALANRIQRWRDLLEIVRPTAVVADHAPTALLTARALGIPTVQCGSGFTIPPVDGVCMPPPFRDWETPDAQRMERAEVAINQALLHAASRTGLPLASNLAGLYNAPAVICSVPILDHYPHALRSMSCQAFHYCGSLEPAIAGSKTLIPMWPNTGAVQVTRILAYLKASNPLALPLINALVQYQNQTKISSLVYVEGAQNISNSNANIRIQNTPLPFNELLKATSSQPGATLVIHQGGINVSSQALLAGVPQLLVPEMAEAFITSRALLLKGVGEMLLPDASIERMQKTLAHMIENDLFRRRAVIVANENALFTGDNEALMWDSFKTLLPGTAFD